MRFLNVSVLKGAPTRLSRSVLYGHKLKMQANSRPGPTGDTDVHRLAQRLGHLRLDMWEMIGDGNCQVGRDDSSVCSYHKSATMQCCWLQGAIAFMWRSCDICTARATLTQTI